jgi:hypothetical protein
MANIYWNNVISENWGDIDNWSLDDAGLIPVVDVPWVDNEPAYKTYDLTLAVGATLPPRINVAIGFGVTGTCDIVGIANDSTVNGGTFSGDGFGNTGLGTINSGMFTGSGFINDNFIYDGTFSGDGFVNRYDIYGGTFTGDGFYSYGGTIYDGTFTGDGFGTEASINGGTFTGDGFFNNSGTVNGGTFTGSGFNNGGTINDGTFTGDGFTNSSDIYDGTFSGDGFTNSLNINDGTFTGDGFTNNEFGIINDGTFEITGFTNSGSITFQDINVTSGGTPYTGDFLGQAWLAGDWVSTLPFGTCYYTNASGDRYWGTLSNWNSAADGSGVNPTEVPWTADGGSTIDSDLVDASGGVGINIASMSISGLVTGVCNISDITADSSSINGGTFSGDRFSSSFSLTINGGTFTGDDFSNNDYIYGGTFSGDGFTNSTSGYIYGGTFSGDGFDNQGYIYGGTFTGSGFTFSNGSIYGGTFLPQAVNVTTSGGNTLLSMSGGPTFAYPTPASGGGSDQTIARLLNLPWFINL